jgi:hypothetical protein
LSNRKVAYIATISKIENIEGKDRIKYISLKDLGWQVIGSSELSEGEKIIYIEYDSIISEGPEWAEFLRKRCYSSKYKGFKISAMRMAGLVSYGLILTPKDIGFTDSNFIYLPDGHDLSSMIGAKAIDDAEEFEVHQKQAEPTKFQKFIKKHLYFIWKKFYRKPESNAFPSGDAIKTDETRLQTLTRLFGPDYKGTKLYVTEKIDGMSVTLAYNKGRFKISSRNVCQYNQPIKKAIKELVLANVPKLGKSNQFIEIACKTNIAKEMFDYCNFIKKNCLTVQGELVGPAIQKNKLKLKELDIFIFNIFDPESRRYYNYKYLKNFCYGAKIKQVPLKELTTFKWNNMAEIEEYVKEPMSNSAYPDDQPREGLVFRKYDDSDFLPEAEKEMNGCFSFKVINPSFILN